MFSNLSAKQWKSMRKMAIDMVSMKTYKCAIFVWHYFYFSHSHGAHDHWKSLFCRYWPQQTRNCEIVLYSQTCVNENALQSDDASCIVSVHRLWHAPPLRSCHRHITTSIVTICLWWFMHSKKWMKPLKLSWMIITVMVLEWTFRQGHYSSDVTCAVYQCQISLTI